MSDEGLLSSKTGNNRKAVYRSHYAYFLELCEFDASALINVLAGVSDRKVQNTKLDLQDLDMLFALYKHFNALHCTL